MNYGLVLLLALPLADAALLARAGWRSPAPPRACAAASGALVFLTREDGKNAKLGSLLAARGVATRFGAVDVKLGVLGGRVVTVHPEYEDCRARAAAARVPVRRVMHAALATALSALPPEESGLAEVPRRPA